MSGTETGLMRVITRLNVGGPTRHVRMLMEGLPAELGPQVLVHGPCPPGEGPGLLPVAGRRVPLPDLIRTIAPLRDRRAFAALRRLLRSAAPAIVHTHQGKAGVLGRLAAHRERVPVIVHTYHGHTFNGYFGALKGCAVRLLERRAARISEALICQSASQERDVLRVLGRAAEGRTRVIPPALDPKALEFDPGARPLREILGTPESRLVILVPARLVAVKRPLLAVDLLAGLTAEHDAELWFAGEGPLAEAVRQRARERGLQDRVRLPGYLPRPGKAYASADLVLLTSRMEGTPLVLLEALGSGIPVAAPDVGGVRDLLGEAGLLLPPEESPKAWAAHVSTLLGDRARRADLARRGRALVSSHHTPARMIAALAGLYRELLARI